MGRGEEGLGGMQKREGGERETDKQRERKRPGESDQMKETEASKKRKVYQNQIIKKRQYRENTPIKYRGRE